MPNKNLFVVNKTLKSYLNLGSVCVLKTYMYSLAFFYV